MRRLTRSTLFFDFNFLLHVYLHKHPVFYQKQQNSDLKFPVEEAHRGREKCYSIGNNDNSSNFGFPYL
jgi:hypothetical protein